MSRITESKAYINNFLTYNDLFSLSRQYINGYVLIKKLYDQGLHDFENTQPNLYYMNQLIEWQITEDSDIRITEFFLENPSIIGDTMLNDQHIGIRNGVFINNICNGNVILVKFQATYSMSLCNNLLLILKYYLPGKKTVDQLLCIEIILETVSKRSHFKEFIKSYKTRIVTTDIKQFCDNNTINSNLYRLLSMFTNLDKWKVNHMLKNINGLHRIVNCIDVMWCIKEFL
jgi:hypothetical protein